MQMRTELFKNARAAFLAGDDKAQNQVKIYKQPYEGGEWIVFGIKKNDQDNINFPELRSLLEHELGYDSGQDYFQIIGDSALYSKDSTPFAVSYIKEAIESSKGIILYGYTGAKNKDASALPQRDINQLVSDWVDDESEFGERSCRVIANVVDEHTVTAIDTWGCSISKNVKYFLMVYSDTPQPSAKFGDDIKLSDGLTNRQALCLDGGIQSFRQIINMLALDIKITGVSGLRDLSDINNIRYFDQESKKPYLSAVEFLSYMKSRIQSHQGEVNEVVIEEMAADYLASHVLYNKTKKDAMTKDALWQSAWHDFKAGVWRKLDLFTETAKTLFKAENESVAALRTLHLMRRSSGAAAYEIETPKLDSNTNGF